MDLNTITNIIIEYSGDIIVLIGFIASVCKVISSNKQTTAEIKADANVKALVEENKELRKQNQEIIQCIQEANEENAKLRSVISKGRE